MYKQYMTTIYYSLGRHLFNVVMTIIGYSLWYVSHDHGIVVMQLPSQPYTESVVSVNNYNLFWRNLEKLDIF